MGVQLHESCSPLKQPHAPHYLPWHIFNTVNLRGCSRWIRVYRIPPSTLKSHGLALTESPLLIQHAGAGLLGFPSKDLQYRFLSQFVSVFYVRQRDYSKACAHWMQVCGGMLVCTECQVVTAPCVTTTAACHLSAPQPNHPACARVL